jgi:hypothetical protein
MGNILSIKMSRLYNYLKIVDKYPNIKTLSTELFHNDYQLCLLQLVELFLSTYSLMCDEKFNGNVYVNNIFEVIFFYVKAIFEGIKVVL